MTNKTRSRQEDGLLNFAAGLPWWLGVLLAGLSAAVLHWLAEIPPVESVNGIPTPSYTMRALVGGVARVGQLLFPIVFLAGAGLSAWARSRRRASHRSAPLAQKPGSGETESSGHSPNSAGVHCPVCRSAMVRRRAKSGAPGGRGVLGMPGLSRMPGDSADRVIAGERFPESGRPPTPACGRQPRREEALQEPQDSAVADEAFAFHDLEGRSFRQGAVADIVREAHYDANQCTPAKRALMGRG